MRRPRRGRHLTGPWARARVLAWATVVGWELDYDRPMDSIVEPCRRLNELRLWVLHAGWPESVLCELLNEANSALVLRGGVE